MDVSTPPKVLDVAIALVFDASGHILICRRKPGAVLGGFWEFPGGKVDAGELPQDCAVREVLEETGLCVAAVRPLKIIEHEYPHARVRLNPFVCRLTGGDLQLLEVAEARWIAPESLGDYEFPEANRTLIGCAAQGFGVLLERF